VSTSASFVGPVSSHPVGGTRKRSCWCSSSLRTRLSQSASQLVKQTKPGSQFCGPPGDGKCVRGWRQLQALVGERGGTRGARYKEQRGCTVNGEERLWTETSLAWLSRQTGSAKKSHERSRVVLDTFA